MDMTLQTEQLRLHRTILAGSVAVSAFLGIVLVTLMWDTVDRTTMLGWLACLALVLGARLVVAWAHGGAAPAHGNNAAWLWRYRFAFAAHGMVWALASVLLLPKVNDAHFTLLVVAIIGISAGAFIATAFDLVAAGMFATPVLASVALYIFTLSDRNSLGMVVIVSLFVVTTFVIALRFHRLVRESVKQRLLLEEAITKGKKAELGLIDAQKIAQVGSFEWNPVSGELLWSDEHYRLWGLVPQSIMPSYDLFRQGIHPDDVSKMEEALQQALHGSRVYECEYRVIWPDGSEHYIHSLGEVTFDNAGQATRMVGAVQDITAVKQASEVIECLSARLQLATESAGIGIWNWDVINNNLVWDKPMFKLYGIEPSEFSGAYDAWVKGLHPEDVGRATEESRLALSGEHSYDTEFRVVWPNGEVHWLKAKAIVQRDANGTPTNMVGVNWDITEQKTIEKNLIVARDQAERSSQAKSAFLSRMSHELRTPLNSIIGFSQVMEMSADDEKLGLHRGHIKTILRSGWHLLKIIEDLLNLSAIEAKKVALNIEPVDVRNCVNECFELMSPLAKERGISLAYADDDCPGVMVRADSFRLEQVLINLLANAVKYNREGGSIQVSMRCQSDRMRILIADTGQGIPEDELPSLFQPFSRLTRRPFSIEGAGIGLSVAKQLTELMDGTIGVESVVGKGSTFWIELPTAHTLPGPAPVGKPSTVQVNSTTIDHQATLLYIEDNPDHVSLVRELVSKMGNLLILTAHTPALGLDLARAHRPDLILLDICLPGMDGHEVLKVLQTSEPTRNIPVIAISASANPAEIEKNLLAGFRRYLTKPLDIQEFRSTVSEVLRDSGFVERERPEGTVSDGERKYRLLFDQANDGIFLLDATGFLDCNQQAARMFGLTREELIGRSPADLCPERQADGQLSAIVFAEKINAAMRGEVLKFEWTALRADGVSFDAEISLSRVEVGGEIYLQAIARDITERKRTEVKLRIAATAFESQEGVMITDANCVILQVNRAFTETTGYTAEEAVGQTPRLLQSGRHDKPFYAEMWERIKNTGGWQGEIWDRRKNGEVYPKWLSISAVRNDDGAVTHYVGKHYDISERKKEEEKINELAFFDQLTGLPNRTLLLDRLRQTMAVSSRDGSYGALLFIDLDNFKMVNDTLGHNIGDVLLKQVAQRLTTCVREGDTVARLGGDEFVVMLASLSVNEKDAAVSAETVTGKILAALNQMYQLGDATHHSTPSIGVTLFKGQQAPIDELLKQADLAMYRSKAAGRNTVRFFNPAMEVAVKERAMREMDLRRALEEKQFLLHYQAQVAGDGRMTGVEVLVRWQHPQRGLVSPAEFLPLAEETGLILPLGRWVLETACTQLAIWATRPELAHFTVAVNVSARQFCQPDFVDQVLAVLHNTGANPQRLKLELTESLLVSNTSAVIEAMIALKAKGVGFSLDDFGTGYSDLKHLPLDQLKINQSFVCDVLTDSNDAANAKTIIALAQSLGIDVIAKGVETAEQRDFLSNAGCPAFQGHFFSRPLPLESFEQLVQLV